MEANSTLGKSNFTITCSKMIILKVMRTPLLVHKVKYQYYKSNSVY